MRSVSKFLKKSLGLSFFLLMLGAGVAIAALTFTGTQFTGDGAVTINASTTISIGTSETTGITIGRSGQTVSFPGTVSSSILIADTSLKIATGTSITFHYSATSSITFSSISSSSPCSEQGVSVSGTTPGDTIVLGPPSNVASNTVWSGYVSSTANTISVRLCFAGTSNTTIVPVAGVWRADVWKH